MKPAARVAALACCMATLALCAWTWYGPALEATPKACLFTRPLSTCSPVAIAPRMNSPRSPIATRRHARYSMAMHNVMTTVGSAIAQPRPTIAPLHAVTAAVAGTISRWTPFLCLGLAFIVLFAWYMRFRGSKIRNSPLALLTTSGGPPSAAMPITLKVDAAAPDLAAIEQAAAALAKGQLVIMPTETVYGVAADPAVAGASDALYAAKGRDNNKPVAFLAGGVSQVEAAGADFGTTGRALATHYWPGALTLVLRMPDGTFQGFRVPAHAVPLAVAARCPSSLMLTSANLSGDADPKSAADAVRALGDSVAVALDSGPVADGVPSTVVKLDGTSLTLLREGAVSFEEVRALHERHLPV